jgi:hypothetical protein
VRWFEKAAEAGSPNGMVFLGAMYSQGAGVPANDKEAVKWYRRAAEGGDTVAMDALGQMYALGRGVPKDETEAVEWFRTAAAKGNLSAKSHLLQLHAGAPPQVSGTIPGSASVAVPANQPWTDTGVNLNPGDIVSISASGSVSLTSDGRIPPQSPSGYLPNCRAVPVGYALGAAPFPAPLLACWSLIGRVGTAGTIYEIGSKRSFQVRTGGRLFLGINDNNLNDNSGNWTAIIVVKPSR